MRNFIFYFLIIFTFIFDLSCVPRYDYIPKKLPDYSIKDKKLIFKNDQCNLEISGYYRRPGDSQQVTYFDLLIENKSDELLIEYKKIGLFAKDIFKTFELIDCITEGGRSDKLIKINPNKVQNIHVYYQLIDSTLVFPKDHIKEVEISVNVVTSKYNEKIELPKFVFIADTTK